MASLHSCRQVQPEVKRPFWNFTHGNAMRIEGGELIFSDENLIILNKRSGVAVIPARGEDPSISLRSRVESHFGQKIFVVHRIDRDTSGIVVFCRKAEAHRVLCRQFQNREVEKRYMALVAGKMAGSGEIDIPVRQFGSGRMGVADQGKPSVTRYRVMETLESATLVNVFPVTGRRHQIRVHLYATGHPVLGDRLYGKPLPVGGVERLMLHAASIVFNYESSGRFTAEAPEDRTWKEVLARFRNSPPGGKTIFPENDHSYLPSGSAARI